MSQDLIESMRRLFCRYRDPNNPPPEAPLAVQWNRIPGSLYVHSVKAGDIVQGTLGDCWFLGALASVASRQDLLLDLIVMRSSTLQLRGAC